VGAGKVVAAQYASYTKKIPVQIPKKFLTMKPEDLKRGGLILFVSLLCYLNFF
jgi:hypothetical protein